MNWKEEYSEEFDKLRKNRVEVSYYKYGPAKDNFGQHLVNAIESHDLCIKKYQETGNTEYLRLKPSFSQGYWVNKPDTTGTVSLLRIYVS